ncbi:hypothetical protein K503DRAFT_766167 [Rhizopogon vinicolor AM-OR11-026]|uniref:Uncharacterized protein n=1 Tax=Rhizopogon vinicolor AM-OR11-026 TaxID=1314800 RepID=A0A1B7NE22_9AGAM|nr:hypothetical protein K503DRAFT_766167 [Rhizopogon vinicolor AM-OR11-026]
MTRDTNRQHHYSALLVGEGDRLSSGIWSIACIVQGLMSVWEARQTGSYIIILKVGDMIKLRLQDDVACDMHQSIGNVVRNKERESLKRGL